MATFTYCNKGSCKKKRRQARLLDHQTLHLKCSYYPCIMYPLLLLLSCLSHALFWSPLSFFYLKGGVQTGERLSLDQTVTSLRHAVHVRGVKCNASFCCHVRGLHLIISHTNSYFPLKCMYMYFWSPWRRLYHHNILCVCSTSLLSHYSTRYNVTWALHLCAHFDISGLSYGTRRK